MPARHTRENLAMISSKMLWGPSRKISILLDITKEALADKVTSDHQIGLSFKSLCLN